MKRLYDALINGADKSQHFFLLAVRLIWGYGFFQAGLNKINNMPQIIDYFDKITLFGKSTIGLPGGGTINAYLAAYTEFGLGLALIAGFASRAIAIPLAFTMLVASATTDHWVKFTRIPAEINGPLNEFMWAIGKFAGEAPFAYLLAALIVLFFGPGLLSVDGVLEVTVFGKPKSEA